MNVLDGPSEVCHHRERSPRLLRRSVDPAPGTARPSTLVLTQTTIGTGTSPVTVWLGASP